MKRESGAARFARRALVKDFLTIIISCIRRNGRRRRRSRSSVIFSAKGHCHCVRFFTFYQPHATFHILPFTMSLIIVGYMQMRLSLARYANLINKTNSRSATNSLQAVYQDRSIGNLRLLTAAFSTSASKTVFANPISNSPHLKWRFLARLVYYLRLPSLVLSVYVLHYESNRLSSAMELF